MSTSQIPIRTRSQTNQLKNSCINNSIYISTSTSKMKRDKQLNELAIDINFDEASTFWHANKKRVGHEYIYICTQPLKSGKLAGQPCGKVCHKDSLTCFIHKNTFETK
jgi:hypothetical protein